MNSNDNKNEENREPEQPLLGQSEQPKIDNAQTSQISQSRSATTQSVAESMARIRNQMGDSYGQQKSSITLNILGVDTPITFYDKVQITLGRRNPDTNEHPDVDLSGLSLNAAGISRKHLNLVYTSGQWFAEDLGSRNGTWLNSKLLMAYQRYKLHDGDQLRTGGISIIVLMHTDETQSMRPKAMSKILLPDQLVLTTSALVDTQLGLSVGYMKNHLMPYMGAVIEMAQHVDRAKKRPQREISIGLIEFNHPIITARLTCPHEVLQFMSGESLLSTQPPTISEATNTLQSTPTIADQANLLARQFADEYFPLITADQSLFYQRLLAPLMAVCIESDIRIVI